MIKEAKGFGSTIEEAKENAIANLGASDFDDVQFDVIAMPKKKVLGIFGGNDAEVRAYIELPDKKTAPKKNENKKPQNTKKAEPKKAEKPAKTESKPKTKKGVNNTPVLKKLYSTVAFSLCK